jgi:hypothetical protein
MRKYFFALLLILFGIAFLAYVYVENNKTIYSETVFSDESKLFNESFVGFTDNVNENIQLIRTEFNNSDNIKTSSRHKIFF